MNSIPNISSRIPVVAQNVIYDNTTSGLQATNVQDAIDEVAQGGETTDWSSSGTATSVVDCAYRKKNGIVFIRFSASNVTVTGSESVGTLPVGFRPLERVTLRNAFAGNNDGSFYINTDGTIVYNCTAGSGRYIGGIISYPL